ncbi:putative leucine-rich repeat-containing protein DDB_G0290503 [Ambystoma mexicanum]|uniref:putative leucine-rich repeat-containing protein DDB_G0290503 n=1 Tax=Ambystoma mexicanum TaxID=8296 RepID=UPI0037E9BAAE
MEFNSAEIAQKTRSCSSTVSTKPIEKEVEKSKQQNEKEVDKEQALPPPNPPETSKSIDTNTKNLGSKPITEDGKKNEREWYDIFENPKICSGVSNEKRSKIAKLNSNDCNKKSKNQQVKKNRKARSSANFFRNIKALNINVNNSELSTLKGEKKKKDDEIQIVDEKVQPVNLTEDNMTLTGRKIELDVEDIEGDEEELLNMSTYSVSDAEENKDNNRVVKTIENGSNIGQDNRESETSPQKPSTEGYEKEKDDRTSSKRVISWPETPKKLQFTAKKITKKVEDPQIFFTLEEKRLKSMLKQGNSSKIREVTKNPILDEQKNNMHGTELPKENLQQSTREVQASRGNVEESAKSRNPNLIVGNKTTRKNHQYRLLVEKIDGRKGGTPLNRYTILQIFQKIPVLRVINSARIDRVEIMAEMNQKFVLLHINDKKDAELIMMSERQLLEVGYQVYEVDNTLKGSDDAKTKEPKVQKINEKDLVTIKTTEKSVIKEYVSNVKFKDTEMETEVAGLPDDIKTKKIKITVDNREKLGPVNSKSPEVNSDEDEGKKWSWLAKSLNPTTKS